VDSVLAAYNAGSGNVSKWLNDEEYSCDNNTLSMIPYKETEDYLVRVKKSYNVYSKIYKQYIMNSKGSDSFYINILNNIRKIIKLAYNNMGKNIEGQKRHIHPYIWYFIVIYG